MNRIPGILLVFPLLLAARLLAEPATEPSWPHPVPCRVHDGPNPDLFVMTLGDVHTPIADGVFDPAGDLVRLNGGRVITNYYQDRLNLKYYQPIDKTRFPLPPSGWCSWYYYYNRPNAAEIEQNAAWIAAHLKDFGARVIQVDDGWQGDGSRNGQRDWGTVNADHFPRGMSDLAGEIRSLGLVPGLWLAPHGQSNPAFVTNHPGLFLHRADGSLDASQQRWEGRYLLDPSCPEATDYLRGLFSSLVKSGFDYFKIDGQPTVVDEYRQKQSLLEKPADPDELYRRTLRAIRDAIGPDRYLLGCWGTPVEGAGIFNGSRTGGDVVLGWAGFQVALRPTMQFYYLHNIVWYCDPDVVLVRPPLTLDQARAWATLEGLTGQALMSSDRLTDLPEDRVELLRRIYPATDIRPLDLFPSDRNKRIWDLKISKAGRNYDVVGIFNFEADRAEQLRLKWADLGLPSDQPVHVFDFWNDEYLGAWAQGMAVSVPPTACRVLTLLPDNGKIQLISTSRHLTQGWVDLAELEQDRAGTAFRGRSDVVKNDPYELRFAFPRGTNYVIQEASARVGWHRLPVQVANHQGWAAAKFTSSSTGEVKWTVRFVRTNAYDYPPGDPSGLTAEADGPAGVRLRWQDQYYLNDGYQVYLNGQLLGYTPTATFPVGDLDGKSNYVAAVRTVSVAGRVSPRAAEVNFSPAALAPARLSLEQVEPVSSTGRWRGFEAGDLLPRTPIRLAGKVYASGLSAFAGAESEFDLAGIYDRFTAVAGLDDNSSERATAEFIVVGDGKELWRSGELSRTNRPATIDLSIVGVHRLVLRSTGTGGRRIRAQADWALPTVSKAEPQ